MPVEGLSHDNVRSYYKGIKEFRADEKRGDLQAGQWTSDTQRMRAVTRAMIAAPPDAPEEAKIAIEAGFSSLGEFRRADIYVSPSAACAAAAAPFGVQARLRGLGDLASVRWIGLLLGNVDPHPVAHVAGVAQVGALRAALGTEPPLDDGPSLLRAAQMASRDAERLLAAPSLVSAKLARLDTHLDDTPLDLRDAAGGSGSAADQAAPFAIAVVARSPALLEATLLSAINVGGDTSAVGSMVGALLGALHGVGAFPRDWLDALEDADAIRSEAESLIKAFGL